MTRSICCPYILHSVISIMYYLVSLSQLLWIGNASVSWLAHYFYLDMTFVKGMIPLLEEILDQGPNEERCATSFPFSLKIHVMPLGMSRGRGNPWGSGVRVCSGRGGGLDFDTPDPSKHPSPKSHQNSFLSLDKPIVSLRFHIYTCLCLPNSSRDLPYLEPPSWYLDRFLLFSV